MRSVHSLVAAALLACLVPAPAHGQQLLKKLESKIRTAIDNVVAEPAAGAPGTGYLGVVADETDVPGQGVLVRMVRKGAPSELGGLKDGDIITAINDKPCRGLDDLDAALDQATVGTKLNMVVNRGGQNQTLTVTLGKKPTAPSGTEPAVGAPPAITPPAIPAPPTDPLLLPAAPPIGATPPVPPIPAIPATPATPSTPATPAVPPTLDLPAPPPTDPLASPPAGTPVDPTLPPPGGRPSLGVTVVPLNDQSRAQFGVRAPVRQGAVIVDIRAGGPADTAGLPRGGLIVRIDGIDVRSADDLIGIVSAARIGQEMEVQYYDGDRLFTRTVRLAPAAVSALVPAVPPETPPASGPDRPLLRRFEGLLDPFRAPEDPRTPIGSTILDPSAIKVLFDRVKVLEEQNADLLDRVKLLEAKLGATPPAATPNSPPALPPFSP